MPYSFTKIEEDKTKTIGLVFFFLILFYFVSFWVISLAVYNFSNFQYSESTDALNFKWFEWTTNVYIFGFALIVAICHWLYTVDNLCQKILRVLRAESLNPKDSYHQRFHNIIGEVSVATGRSEIEGVVVPSMSMNAFALCDFNDRAIIGVTEGLLARLNRAQLEAVVGHEAAHIISGDCLQTTVTSSMFELYSGILRGIEELFGHSAHIRYSGRDGRGGIAIVFFVYMLLSVTKFMGQMMNMFISREREYRADAIAVRLTRDPLSLAEALYTIRYRWRGSGLAAGELEAIFIINPKYSRLDESDDTWSNLFSTHPPIEKRLSVLMDMAYADIKTMTEELEAKDKKPRISVPRVASEKKQWKVHRDGKWEGPFELIQLLTFDWLRPDMWINKVGTENVLMARDEPDIKAAVIKDNQVSGHFNCPNCHLPLSKIYYEGLEADQCPFCYGKLLRENDVMRIIVREEIGFSDDIVRAAEIMKQEIKEWKKIQILRDPRTLLKCPKCQHPRARMHRMFYTPVYHVEVDKCFTCRYIWFDQPEMEILQYLIESNQQKQDQG